MAPSYNVTGLWEAIVRIIQAFVGLQSSFIRLISHYYNPYNDQDHFKATLQRKWHDNLLSESLHSKQ